MYKTKCRHCGKTFKDHSMKWMCPAKKTKLTFYASLNNFSTVTSFEQDLTGWTNINVKLPAKNEWVMLGTFFDGMYDWRYKPGFRKGNYFIIPGSSWIPLYWRQLTNKEKD